MGDISIGELMKIGADIGADPARLGWPPTLPIEIALKTAPLDKIQEEYGYSDDEWMALRDNPVFIKELIQALETVRQDGMSFKLKARLQADELLKQSWKMIHAPTGDVPATVRADLIKATMRWAGYDNKDATAGGATATSGLQINIQFNDTKP